MSVEIASFNTDEAERVYSQRENAATTSERPVVDENEVESSPSERDVPTEVAIDKDKEARRPSNNVLETRKGKIRQWSELSYHLPENISPHHECFLKGYFKAQLRITEGQKVRAREIFDGLVKKKGYKEFEENNQVLLAAIDIVVRGATNRRPLEDPGFRVEES